MYTRREEKMVNNTEKKTTSCQGFHDLHPNIPLWMVLFFKEFQNEDLTETEIDLIYDLLTSKGKKDKLIFVFNSSLLDILFKKMTEYSDCEVEKTEKILFIIQNFTVANKKEFDVNWTLSYKEKPQNGDEVINLSKDKFSNYLQTTSVDFTTFPLEIIDTNNLEKVLSHEYSLIDKKRRNYLVDGYGGRCDEMFTNQVKLFKTSIRNNSNFHVDGPDVQIQSGGREKLNFSHIHPKKGYAFYLIDNFFDIKKIQENLWKHKGNGEKYRVPREIKKVLKEHNFFIPSDIK